METDITTERLPGESGRAFRAFCFYRDLGPDRSLDKAWKSFLDSNPGKPRRATRRDGHWSDWCRRFKWVERSDAHDDLIEEAKRTADAERRELLEEERSCLEVETVRSTREVLRRVDSAM